MRRRRPSSSGTSLKTMYPLVLDFVVDVVRRNLDELYRRVRKLMLVDCGPGGWQRRFRRRAALSETDIMVSEDRRVVPRRPVDLICAVDSNPKPFDKDGTSTGR